MLRIKFPVEEPLTHRASGGRSFPSNTPTVPGSASMTQAEAHVATWPGITPAQAKRVAALLRHGAAK